MCISESVGLKGRNHRTDVKVVQSLINLNAPVTKARYIAVDGQIGKPTTSETVRAIRTYQEKVLHLEPPDSRVDPLPGGTLRTLRARMEPAFTEMKMKGIMAGGGASDVAKFYLPVMATMQARQINTPLRMAHFLAQLGHESGDFKYTEELASGEAYEGRADLGNTQPGDGKRFKGRGLIQLTGRANYTAFGKSKGTNLVDGESPKRVSTEVALAVDAAGWFWTKHGLNKLADADDVKAITKKINGGYNGLEDRKKRLARAKFFLIK